MKSYNKRAPSYQTSQEGEIVHTETAAAPAASTYHMRIILKEQGRFVAILNNQKVTLTTAMSCLIEPEIGDLVLSSISTDAPAGYILSVLERPGDNSHTRVVLPVNSTITAATGDITIHAEDNLHVLSGNGVNVEAPRYTNSAQTVDYHNTAITFNAVSLRTQLKNAYWNCSDTFFIQTLNSTLHCKNSMRTVTGHEEVLTASFRQYAQTNWVLHTRTTSMHADETTSIKAGLLQLG